MNSMGTWLRSPYNDLLRAGRSCDRISVTARFSAPVQTGRGDHPASYTMGTECVLGLKRLGCGVDHTPYLMPRLKKEYCYTSTPRLGLRNLF